MLVYRNNNTSIIYPFEADSIPPELFCILYISIALPKLYIGKAVYLCDVKFQDGIFSASVIADLTLLGTFRYTGSSCIIMLSSVGANGMLILFLLPLILFNLLTKIKIDQRCLSYVYNNGKIKSTKINKYGKILLRSLDNNKLKINCSGYILADVQDSDIKIKRTYEHSYNLNKNNNKVIPAHILSILGIGNKTVVFKTDSLNINLHSTLNNNVITIKLESSKNFRSC